MALGFVPFVIVLLRRAKRFSKFEEQLPGALGLVVSALRVGHSLNAALGLIARESPQPIAGEFKICFDEQNFGLELRTAFENLLSRVPLKDLKIVVTAILVQKESGGNLAEVLTNTAHVIRERFRLKRQVRTHTAQGRLTGWILCFLPIVLGCALYVVNPETMRLLWTRAIGIKLLYAASGMIIIGSLIINKIVKMEV
jgi:tight adherence protein B